MKGATPQIRNFFYQKTGVFWAGFFGKKTHLPKIEEEQIIHLQQLFRFGGQRIRIFLSILALLLYIFTKISVGFVLFSSQSNMNEIQVFERYD